MWALASGPYTSALDRPTPWTQRAPRAFACGQAESVATKENIRPFPVAAALRPQTGPATSSFEATFFPDRVADLEP